MFLLTVHKDVKKFIILIRKERKKEEIRKRDGRE